MACVKFASNVGARGSLMTPFDTCHPSRSSGAVYAIQFPLGALPSIRSKVFARSTTALSSSQSKTFGSIEFFRCFAATSGSEPSQGTRAVAEFTKEQAALVKETWKLLKKDAGKNGMTLFLKVFEIAPSAQQLFSFLKDSKVPLEENVQLKGHALNVFKMTGDAAAQLGEKGALDALHPKLVELGQSHVVHGVMNEHFDVVKFALLQTIQEGLPDMWSPELKAAWAKAYDVLVDGIKAEMRAKKAADEAVAATA